MSYTNIRYPSTQRVAERRLPPGPPLLIEPERRGALFWIKGFAEAAVYLAVVAVVLSLVNV